MKRSLFCILMVLTVLLSFAAPAAAVDYGVYYDETESLWTPELERLGTEVLPAFRETYGIDLRVDVLTGMGDFATVEECAASVYERYEYGAETNGHGVSLTVVVTEDETGYALSQWCAHFGGDSQELTTNGPWNIPKVYGIMTEEAWSGDLQQDAWVLEGAVGYFVEGLEAFVLAGGVHSSIYAVTERTEEPPAQEPAAVTTEYAVLDPADLLTAAQWQDLETRAQAVAETYGVGVYILAMDDFRTTGENDVFYAAMAQYNAYGMGLGEDRDGILLLLSMADRDYSLITYGTEAEYAFDDAGREAMTEFFLDDFAGDDWYGGFSDYLDWCETYLAAAAKGEPFTWGHLPVSGAEKAKKLAIYAAVILLVPLAVAGIVIAICNAKMKSVASATHAAAYVTQPLQLTGSMDNYTHTTTTRVRKSSSSSSGGGGRSSSSGGFSGTSGKF